MSIRKHETISDIVREMRRNEEVFHHLYWCEFADRIEAAAKHHFRGLTKMISDYKNILHLGNAAKMRDALERIRRELILDSCRHTITKFHDIVCEVSYSALVAPPRNCDVLSKEEALEVLDDRSFSKEDTIEWLYAEAKGEAK